MICCFFGIHFLIVCLKEGVVHIYHGILVSVTVQAARALANIAAHGDNNSNNASVGQEAGALEALVLLTRSPHDGVRYTYILFEL